MLMQSPSESRWYRLHQHKTPVIFLLTISTEKPGWNKRGCPLLPHMFLLLSFCLYRQQKNPPCLIALLIALVSVPFMEDEEPRGSLAWQEGAVSTKQRLLLHHGLLLAQGESVPLM